MLCVQFVKKTLKRCLFAALIGFFSIGNAHFARASETSNLELNKNHIMIYTYVLSVTITIYMVAVDANKQSADMNEWERDFTTVFNIIWRSVFFGWMKGEEGKVRDMISKARQIKDLDLEAKGIERNIFLSKLRIISSCVTYNTRYNETVLQRYEGFEENFQENGGGNWSPYFAGASLFFSNVILFYIQSLWSPHVNTFYYSYTANPKILGSRVLNMGFPYALGFMTYMLSDYLFTHVLISIKDTMRGMLPASSNLEFFRFPDCTMCYMGTNLMGKNGPIGKHLYGLRQDILEQCRDLSEEDIAKLKDEL